MANCFTILSIRRDSFEKYNISKEIESYNKSDKYMDLFFVDGEHLLINTSYKTRKNKQLIRDFFD